MQLERSLLQPSIAQLQSELRSGLMTATELVQQAKKAASEFAGLNSIAYADWGAALNQAQACDQQIAQGRVDSLGALAGIPISVKDLYAVQGMPMKAGSNAKLPNVLVAQALAVTRLQQAGAIIFAKTNMHELAMGATGENSVTGDVCNPFDPSRQSGGSSSGAAVAVATGIGVAAIGSDTGGSIRVPAAFCNVVGFKPTYAAISLEGAVPLSTSFDHAGPITRCVADSRLMFEVMTGVSTNLPKIKRPWRFAVPHDWLQNRLADSVAKAFEQRLNALREAGAVIESVQIPLLPTAWDFYSYIVMAQAASVHRSAIATDLNLFSQILQPRLTAGLTISAVDYIQAMNARDALSLQLNAITSEFDALILPTTAVPPPLRGQLDVMVADGKTSTVREAVLGQTLPFSACGLPTLQLPMAWLSAHGSTPSLPIGMQVVCAKGADATALSIGEWMERV
jgi:aspartyl-tRNA(Asn)/glutamyl-tRNA(Gln) amidotransferase subunit A